MSGAGQGPSGHAPPPYVLTLKVDPRWLDRLGPAMTGSFDAELLYRGNEETVHDIEVEMRAPGSLLDLYPNEELIAERDVFYFHFDELKRGEPAALEKGRTPASEAGWKIYFALADEEEPRIRKEVLTDGGSIPLEGSIEVELREGFPMTKQEVEIRIRMQDDSPARIVFPDFSGKLGAPGPVCAGGRVDEAELQYNRAGDPGWSPTREAFVRIHAVRAGRLDEERLEDEASLGRPEKALRFFPDSALGAAAGY